VAKGCKESSIWREECDEKSGSRFGVVCSSQYFKLNDNEHRGMSNGGKETACHFHPTTEVPPWRTGEVRKRLL